jgi:riboflavin synthase
MFTGIIETLGVVEAVDTAEDSSRLTIKGAVTDGTAVGDSIAVNGVCLTATTLDGDAFTADVMAETLRRSTLGDLHPGAAVNLERAATATTRLGGHLVQGHVDGVGRLTARAPAGAFDEVTIALPADLLGYVVEKGSIAVDGISLTVAKLGDGEITIGLIPETLQRTTLGQRQVGDPVNIEVDVIAKYVERLLETRLGAGEAGTVSGRRAGWRT